MLNLAYAAGYVEQLPVTLPSTSVGAAGMAMPVWLVDTLCGRLVGAVLFWLFITLHPANVCLHAVPQMLLLRPCWETCSELSSRLPQPMPGTVSYWVPAHALNCLRWLQLGLGTPLQSWLSIKSSSLPPRSFSPTSSSSAQVGTLSL